MTRELLLASARGLEQPPLDVTEAFLARRDVVALRLAAAMTARPDIAALVGADGVVKINDNSVNLCRFMGAVFSFYVPEVLVDTILWVFRSYRAHGFQVAFWPANLATLLDVLRAELPPDAFRSVAPFFDWMLVNIPVFTELTNPGDEGGT